MSELDVQPIDKLSNTLPPTRKIVATDILLPNVDLEKWAVIACDQFTAEKSYWGHIAQHVGDAPSTLRFIIPEAFLDEPIQNRIEGVRENMLGTLKNCGWRKLKSGGVFIKRKISSGIRYGILAAIDLEQFSFALQENVIFAASEAIIPNRLSTRIALREQLPLEFSHAMFFFEDKADIIVNELNSMSLKQLYSFDLMEFGGHIEGYFLDAKQLERIDSIISSPIFVADGNHSLAAAKIFWEKLKIHLSKDQYNSHPARFYLAELVNIYSEAVQLYPIHRLITRINEDHFWTYFSKKMPCTRKDNLILPSLKDEFTTLKRVDDLLENYVQQYGGTIEYIHDETKLNKLLMAHAFGIWQNPFKKEEILAYLKAGYLLPRKAFSVGRAIDKRYYLEGRYLHI